MKPPCTLVGLHRAALAALALALGAVGIVGAPGNHPPPMIELGDVVFPHALHINDLGLECLTCHHETSARRLSVPHPEYFEDLWIDCKTCHRPQGEPSGPQRCSACHRPTPSDIADETLSAKVVLHRACWTCHEVGRGRDASASCGACHARRAANRHDAGRSGS